MAAAWGRLETVSPHWPSKDLTSRAQGGKRAVIGRKNVQVADAHISASHCVIEVEACDASGGPPKAWAHDMSTNGVFVNGVKIGKGNKACVLSGDLLSFVVAPSKKDDGSYDVEDKHLKWAAYIISLYHPDTASLTPPSTIAAAQPTSATVKMQSVIGTPAEPHPAEPEGHAGRGTPVTCPWPQSKAGDTHRPVLSPPPKASVPVGVPAASAAAASASAAATPDTDTLKDKRAESNRRERASETACEAAGVADGCLDGGTKRAREGEDRPQPLVAQNAEAVDIDYGPMVWDADPPRARESVTGVSSGDNDRGKREFDARYSLDKKLGDGGYADVKLGVHIKSGTKVAVKIINYAKWKVHNNGITRDQLEAEFKIHAGLKHPNVVRMHTVFKGLQSIYVVLELVSGGDLFDFLIQKAQHGVNESVARRWMGHLLDGVQYCHQQNVVHRDLKPENILLSHQDADAVLKIADFGLAKALTGRNGCQTNCGTPQYMAPEVHFRGDMTMAKTVHSYGKEADLWGLGVILHVMLTCTMPFGNEHDSQDLFDEIKAHASTASSHLMRGEAWEAVSLEVKDLISGLLTADVVARTTIEGARQHAWFSAAGGSGGPAVKPSPKKRRT